MALDFSLSEEQLMLQRTVRDVLRPFRDRGDLYDRIVKRREFPQDLWDALAEAGFMGCMIPERYGGTEMGLLAMVFVVEELAAMGLGNAVLILTAMDALCIARAGSEELKQRWLPAIARGERRMCFAVTEARAGTNTFRIETHARREGDSYVLHGSKTFISGVDHAEHILLVARTTTRAECEAAGLGSSYGLSLFLVPTDAPGLERQLIPMASIEGTNQWSLFLEGVRVPAENLVGDENAGTMALFQVLNPERIFVGAVAIGVARYCLERACDYARQRRVFRDVPIGQYQAVQHPLARVRIQEEAVRLLCYKAAWAFDQGLSAMEVGFAANATKYLGSQLGVDAADAALQTLGGNGFAEEYRLVHLWEGMRLLKTAPLNNEMILNYVAEHTLDLPKSY